MANDTSLLQKLLQIQYDLKVPKGQRNNFGGYNYRSAEDIENALKPLLKEHGITLSLTDDIREIGGKNYILSTARLNKGDEFIETRGVAREADNQKGMVDAQITGSTSSYARKYALGAMFLIDDTDDPDATNDHSKGLTDTERKSAVARKEADYKTVKYLEDTADAKAVIDRSEGLMSDKQADLIKSLARKAGKNSQWISEEYNVVWPEVDRVLAKQIIDDLFVLTGQKKNS